MASAARAHEARKPTGNRGLSVDLRGLEPLTSCTAYVQSGPEGQKCYRSNRCGAAVLISATWIAPAAIARASQTLTQVVEHDSSFTYPVVADPTYTTHVSYLSKAQVVSMYNGFNYCSYTTCTAVP